MNIGINIEVHATRSVKDIDLKSLEFLGSVLVAVLG
jgi:hypothetical protein